MVTYILKLFCAKTAEVHTFITEEILDIPSDRVLSENVLEEEKDLLRVLIARESIHQPQPSSEERIMVSDEVCLRVNATIEGQLWSILQLIEERNPRLCIFRSVPELRKVDPLILYDGTSKAGELTRYDYKGNPWENLVLDMYSGGEHVYHREIDLGVALMFNIIDAAVPSSLVTKEVFDSFENGR